MKSYLSKQLKINPLLLIPLWILGATLGVYAQSPGGVSSGLAHWVRADKSVYSDAGTTLTTAGQTVQQMNDQSGNGLHVTALSATQKPILLGGTLQTNFNPSLDFTSDYLINTNRVVQTTDGVSMYSVGSTRVFSGVRTMYSLGTNGNEPTVDLQSTLISPYNTGSSPSNVDIFNNQMTLNQSMIWGLRAANNVANDFKFSFQGEELATTLEILSSNSAYGNRVHVGKGVDSEWSGLIMEGITYNRSLTSAEAQRVNSYLALKYGITLRTVDTDGSITEGNYVSSAGTVIWNKTANTAYHNNVTGIGRDDASELVQKQSRSINTEALVTFGVGTGIAASNALNSNSFSTDASFEVIGDNGLSTAYATAYLPQTYVSPVPSGFKIMSRIWKVQETGTLGTVTISVPASSKAELLLVSSSATFTPGSSTEITMTPDGNGNLTAQVDLTDGQYFTFGTTLIAPGGVVADLALWTKADAGTSSTTNGGFINTWLDQSMNQYQMTSQVDSRRPKYTSPSSSSNFNPTVLFDGVNSGLELAPFMTGVELGGSVFGAAANKTPGTGFDNLVVFGIDNPHLGTATSTGKPLGYMNGSSPIRNDHPASPVPNQFHLWSWKWDMANNPSTTSSNKGLDVIFDGWVNSAPTMEVRESSFADGAPSAKQFSIGSYEAVEVWDGPIGEIAVYKRNLSALENQKVSSYFSIKWGTTLDNDLASTTSNYDYVSANGTSIWAGTTSTPYQSYHRYIAGIGRDDASGLYQKQSHSISSGFHPIMAVGSSVATSNALNTGTIATDASFIVWGGSAGSTSYSVNVAGSSNINTRMARVWKVKKTNWTDQSVTIQINDPQAQYLLIQTSDPTFATITQEIALTNGAATINSSLLSDGAFFTFARQIFPPGGVATNLNFWIIAEEGSLTSDVSTVDGQVIDKVLDKANGGEAYNDDAGANRPTYQSEAGDQLNFHHTMRFGNNNAYWKTTTDVDKDKFDNFAVFTVFKAPPASFGNSSLWGNADGSFQRFSMVNNTSRIWYSPGTTYANVLTPGNWYIASDMVNNTNVSNATQFYTSGKFTGQVTNNSALSGAPLYIGRRGLISDPFYGDMTEVIVYGAGVGSGGSTVMTAAQRRSIESYLAIKYGITLDQSAPQDYLASDQTTKMWDATANGAYKFDITGIGRDDFGNLSQKQSKSVNADNLITIALGSAIAADNESNASVITNDKSFLTWANNDASASFSVSLTGATSTLRLGRVWKADKTNWSDQNITLCYVGGGNNRALLISTDPTFATISQELPLNANGCVTFNSSLLPDGVYFTIGGVLSGPGCVNANLQLWLKAGEGVNTAFGTEIESWFDQSLNGFHPEAVNEPFKVLAGSNFNPVVRFDGTDDYFNWTTNFTNGWTAGEAFYMIKSNRATNVANGFAAWGDTETSHYTWSNQNLYDGFGTTARKNFNPTWDIQQYGIYQSMSKAGQWTAWWNGNQEFTTASNTVQFSQANTNLGYGNLSYFSGDIGEVILYNRELSAPEKQRVNSYLGVKYGLTLAHDYLSGTGTTIYPIAGYNKNIAGIGRDDCQGLIQKQSKSSNVGALLTIGIDNIISTSNELNSGSFDTDASFLVWGDNGVTGTVALAAESPTQCGPPPSADKRLGMIWKVVETGTVESTKLSVDLSGAGFSTDYPVYMLVSTDAVFTSFTTFLLTNDGSNIYSTNVNFDGTKYVTFTGNTAPPANVCDGNKILSWRRPMWPWTTKTKDFDIGDQRITISVTDPSNVGYLNTWYPVRYGRSLYIPRHDNNATAKITTRIQLLDVAAPANKKPASGVDFVIYKLDGWYRGKDVVNVYGKLNGVTVTPKLSRSKYTDITLNSSTQATGNIYWRGWTQWGRLYVTFDTPVDEVYVEYSKDNQYSFKVFNDIAIGDIKITCKPPVPEVATPDNVYLYKEVTPNPGLTEEAFTYKFTIQNLNCDAQTINLNDVLPSGVTWVDSSLATSLTVGTTNNYGGTGTLALGNITIPKGTSYIYIDAISASTGTFANQASFVINGNTYLSDEPSVPGADSPTPITIDQNDPKANITIVKEVDKAQTAQNTEVTYTYKITNNESSNVKVIFQDNLPHKALYVASSLTGAGSALVSAYANENSLTLRDLDLPGGGTETTITIKANVKDTDLDSTVYNFATLVPDGSTTYREVEETSNTVSTKITAPLGSFTFGNCASATVSGTFTANGTAGQTGTLTIPITGAVAGPVSITITATDFATSPAPFEVTLTVGQTSIAIPITYTGAGAAGIRALTVTSAEATGSCAPNVTVIALIDTDGDGTPDATDTDDDGDGLSDAQDPKPLDTDNDGINNDVDTDDDGDGILDSAEAPGQSLDTDNDSTPNATDTDDDNDGIPDTTEQGTLVGGVYTLPDSDGDGLPDLADALDTDGDGIADNVDTDDDGDGLSDAQDPKPLDTDNDGTPNATDTDDDGDGILDSAESPGQVLDTDNDSTPNATDTDDDNDGIPDTTEQGTLVGGVYTLPDSDGDGLPDLADALDTDGDGIADNVDTDDDGDGLSDAQDPKPLDTDNDGINNDVDTDDDGDGILDSAEAPGQSLDTDNDSTPNATDTDDDNDGIPDTTEQGTLVGGVYTLPDSDGDGIPDLADVLDTDGDGIADNVDTDDDGDGLSDAQDPKPLDTDNDGTPNATDTDDDGDGILDSAESPGQSLDTDNDSTPNATDTDDDNDGILDSVEQGTLVGGVYTLPDSDGDGIPDLADALDTDGDGIADNVDTDDDGDGLSDAQDPKPLDTDNDGTPNATDTDDDGDGILDSAEVSGQVLDTDNDSTPNATDTDDDNDGIPDTTEQGTLVGGVYTLPDSDGDGIPDLADALDTDGDGIADNVDTDDDGDGLSDAQDPKPLDTDNDGTPNATDTDDDGDGILDSAESPGQSLDTDNDSTPNATDTDDDNDGILDSVEQGTLVGGVYTLPDSDGDGLPDLADALDTDGDGIADNVDTDDDGDGLSDAQDPKPLDTDNDGINNDVDTDDDGDGILDSAEASGQVLDTDNDNTPNATDTDDDNDGIPDTTEQGTLVGGVYTLPDSDGDGLPDLADALDTDGDGIADNVDTDDDGDGLSDAQDPKPLDTDNDGINNDVDTDDDGDGILDSAESPGQVLDTDNDSTPNATDTDDDNDGIPDTTEQGTLVGGIYTLPDSDGDGLPDLADVLDTDGDGIADNVDTDDDGDGLSDAQDPKPLDTDNDGTPNATDTDDDGDGILDSAESPGQSLDTDNDSTPNATDTDDDNDGILDSVEQGTLVGGVYTLPDSDGDGIPDLADALDTDGDGIADNVDTDDDGDGLSDAQDPKPLDTDNDGTPNATDTDDDGDGILDSAEAPGQSLDTDNDSTPNATDTDDDNDGILDSVEQGTLVGGVYTLPDSDGDGIPDLADVLDTDGDGIADNVDTDDDGDGLSDAQDPKPLDTDNDGINNDVDTDDDGDGILDSAEAPGQSLDTDNDSTPNATDTDDDNDGILDSVEQGTLVGGVYTLPDSDGDGLPDLADALDTDGDGIADNVDTDDDGDGLSDAQDPKPLDTDNDGINNDVDTDDDGDGILDSAEAPGQSLDTDNDSTPNATDTDDDNDGIPDTTEQGTLVGGVYTLPDSDGDGLPDLADALDTDGDGIADNVDTDDDGDGLSDAQDPKPLDTDNDGTPNATDTDDDGDGILDSAESPGQVLDTDNDSTPNATDTDDDNDGIPDTTEQGTLVGGVYTLPDSDGDGLPDLADALDTDGDGIADNVDTDDDGDGLSDAQDPKPLDTDNDGINNDVDTDDDGDGILDSAEAPGQSLDTDNDSTPNATDTDDDNDGIPDTTEQGTLVGGVYTLPDSDGDGIPDLADALDTDGDGIADNVDTDDDGDGLSDAQDPKPLDTDNDGTPNATDTDDDGDGILDSAEASGQVLDTDNDSTPNATDTDDDNDGIPDTTEQGTLVGGVYTLPDSDGDGLPDLADALDTDGDGIADNVDTDDDGDGLSDAQDPKPLDTDNDGTPNATDTDDDGDGILDSAEVSGQVLDTDNDSTPNATDTDDDNDGIPDTTEQGTLVGGVYTLPDSDGDGIPDLADALDTDGDGIADNVDTDDDGDGLSDAQDPKPLDTDNDGTPNATDTDDDGDGILDSAEAPGQVLDTDNDSTPNATDTDDDNDGIPDTTEQGTLVGGVYTLPDSDGDGIPDLADALDTDGDGIADNVDTDDDGDGIPDATDANPLDTDNDGIPNTTDLDDDGDGLLDTQDPKLLDTDNDGQKNDVDTDDDGDGILDTAEQPGQLLDSDNDSTGNETDTDDDGDDIPDTTEQGTLVGGVYSLPDSDGDGTPDLADGINDILDTDGDGTPNSTDTDDDNDGLSDVQDPRPLDTDNDGINNDVDTDDDGDGILDVAEQPGKALDTDNDSTPNATDTDDDNDGILDSAEIGVLDGTGKYTLPDGDGDGLPDLADALNLDVDGDGIPNSTDPDMDGDGINNIYDTDVDGDGTPNATDTDDDGDGTPDATDTTQPNDADGYGTPGNNDGDAIPDASDFDLDGDGTLNDADLDTDNDGIPNTTDTDDDGDGTPDATDTTPQGPVASDVDGDGIPNSTDPDMDGDGINNIYDTDVDGDGTPNATDTDDDGDGTPDATDTTQPNDADGYGTPGNNDGDAIPDASDFDLDGDGTLNDVDLDTDNDGIPNTTDTDDDGDGTPDATDTTPQGPVASDVDGDGIPNSTDPDMDGDGINNIYDTDVDGDGTPNATDTDDDGDGTPDATDTTQPNDADGYGTPGNNDGDAIPDASDFDLDGDGTLNDADLDTDNDGIPNTTDTDDDGDGTPDATDTTPQGPVASDVDGDGIPNSTDPDMDGDGINNIYDTDVDGDGTPNATDTDDDGDGTPDATDTTQPNDADGYGTPGNNDGDAIPDASDFDLDGDGTLNDVDLDTDNDGIPNTTDTDDDGDGTPDATDTTPQGPVASDVDGDGIPNSTDPDMDGDGINNIYDTDVDGDGTPNATDTDDDGDGTPDATDTTQPNDADGYGTPGNNDGDAIPDASDFDLDGDGTLNDVDLDTDNDGIPNTTDTDDDGDGTPDATDTTPQGPVASDVDLFPNATFGSMTFNVGDSKMVVININEIKGNPTIGTMTFFVPLATGFTFGFDPTLTTTTVVVAEMVNNNDWTVVDTGTGLLFTSKPGVVIPAGSRSRVAISVKADTAGTTATITTNITPNSGGDNNSNNNVSVVSMSVQN